MQSKLTKTAGLLVLTLISLIIAIPFVWLFTASLKSDAQFFRKPIEWIPSPALWSHYWTDFVELKYYLYTWNSIILAVSVVILSVASSSFVAYGFARFKFPYRNVIFIIVLSTMMLPGQVTLIPQFILFRDIGWLGTFYPLLVPNLFGNAFLIFLLRQFFMGLSKEMDESAKIDGCGYLRIWWNIILPQSKPALIVSALFVFLGNWRDVFGPLIYLGNPKLYTLPIGLLFFSSPRGTFDHGLYMAAIVITLIPTLIFFIFAQRYLERGIHIANVK